MTEKNEIKKSKEKTVNPDLIYSMSWEWLDKRDPRKIIGTTELSQHLFSHLEIKEAVKFAYLSALVQKGFFPQSDGVVSRAQYWYKDTLEEFREKIQKDLDNKAMQARKTVVFLNEFEEVRKKLRRQITNIPTAKSRIDYFKAEVLETLLSELDRSPSEEAENMIITEISNLWKLCRMNTLPKLSMVG